MALDVSVDRILSEPPPPPLPARDPMAEMPSDDPCRRAPAWLAEWLRERGGAVPFRTYMDRVLNDPVHGAYGSGRLRIGPHGDFATAPSLGPDFAALLAPQLAEWLAALDAGTCAAGPHDAPRPLALIETGPGEGALAGQLARALTDGWPDLARRTELVLVEPNPGMAERQRRQLAGAPLPVRWATFEELERQPLRAVVLAHEVLDALPVERIVRSGDRWCRQLVRLEAGCLRLEPGGPLEGPLAEQAGSLGLEPAGEGRSDGWTTELHPALAAWLAACGRAVSQGHLLVIDYALEAWRYYAPARRSGTLLAYRGQRAGTDPLLDPGHWDLTAHLCLESLQAAAADAGWQPLGQRRQGEALLALGLAQRLHGLQHQGGTDLGELLARREALLRFVDPATLGDFRWVAFRRGAGAAAQPPLFLRDPVAVPSA